LEAKVPGTQFDIDNRFRVRMYDGGALCKVFGSGLAFPTRTNDGRIFPEAGKPNPRADSFSLYLNYVGTKVLDSLLPKSKLNSKVQFVYTDKVLKKRRKDEDEKRKKTEAVNNLINQASETSPVIYKNSKKIIKKTDISRPTPHKQSTIQSNPKTPAKKSFPSKMREQVNSCK
jgi:hypothetical protein